MPRLWREEHWGIYLGQHTKEVAYREQLLQSVLERDLEGTPEQSQIEMFQKESTASDGSAPPSLISSLEEEEKLLDEQVKF